jgi:hypothetical protein
MCNYTSLITKAAVALLYDGYPDSEYVFVILGTTPLPPVGPIKPNLPEISNKPSSHHAAPLPVTTSYHNSHSFGPTTDFQNVVDMKLYLIPFLV